MTAPIGMSPGPRLEGEPEMFTNEISNLHHPTLISQTEPDPHRGRGDQHTHHERHAPEHPKPEHHLTPEELLGEDENKTTGLLIDVRG